MRYSEHYVQVCTAAEAEAARLLGRVLTEREKQAIWGAGTLTWLEMRILVPMRRAQAAEQIETALDSAADELDERLEELLRGLFGMLGALLERDLSEGEHQQLNRIPSVLAAMQFGEDIAAADAPAREALLAQKLRFLG